MNPAPLAPTLVDRGASPEQVLNDTRPVHNAGGGECLFYSFQYHLASLGRFFPGPRALRVAAVQYAVRRWARYKDFALDPVTLEGFASAAEFAARFAADGTDADHVILDALCRAFRVGAYVVVLGMDGRVAPEPILACCRGDRPVLPFLFVPERHYEALAARELAA